jgi:hypothetical protein
MLTLTIMPLWLSGLLMVALPTAIAMAGPFVVRHFVHLDKLRTNNEVAGFKFATVGVMYAVLLAFAVVVVWEKFNLAEHDVANEASAIATIFRLSDALDGEHKDALRAATNAYLTASIDKDWPAMERGMGSNDTMRAISKIYSVLLKTHSLATDNPIVMNELLRQLDDVSTARRSRLVAADGNVPGFLWIVLCGGAVITVGFTFFFGAPNLRAQCFMTGALALIIFSGLLTVIVLDRPFTGRVKVDPEALVHVLKDFGSVSRP